ncbi:EAL domain-containing protein [Noviherbaspirillum saxi]|nr:EAL domain-containing protein [Noviherbaspirillum saxi]
MTSFASGRSDSPLSADDVGKTGFLRRHLLVLIAWPLASLFLACALWAVTLRALNNERDLARDQAFTTASGLAGAYAAQLRHSLQQIDQMLLSLKYDWEEPQIDLNLERQRRKGLYPDSSQLYASIINSSGELVTTTVSKASQEWQGDQDYFKRHRAGMEKGLLISAPETGATQTRPLIRFSRRLQQANGAFDGVAIVTVDPAYLVTFYDESRLGRDDFVSVRRNDGPLLAAKVGQDEDAVRIFYRNDPIFPSPSGILVEPQEKFQDGQPRIVAWKKLDDFPLVALAAVSEHQAYAGYRSVERRYIGAVTVASLFLLLCAAIGMFFSTRLAWRRQQAEEIKQTYRLAVDAAREGFYMLRPILDSKGLAIDFQIEDCNERGAAMLGYRRADIIGTPLSSIYDEDFLSIALIELRRGLELGFYEADLRVDARSRIHAGWVNQRLVRSGPGLALTMRDISDAKAHEEELSTLANIDALTSLPNRHWLTRFLPRALELSADAGQGLAILFVDLDNFKNINDTLGHAAGDELLQAASIRLKSLVRASDHVVRLGGDEFTIVLEQVHKLEDVTRVARQIVKSLGEPFTIAQSSGHHVQASIGISVFPQDGSDGETLLKHADIAMYAAKAAGKGRYHFYQSHLSDSLVLRINREQALRLAIERDEFVLHYQPRVDTATGRLSSMEALVRWMHPERGLVPPLEFIPIAEDTGLILTLGRLVIEKSCAQLAQWKAQGLPVVPVSINVSALQFNEGNVREILAACMDEHGIDPSLIGVELTESCMAGDDEKVSGELDGLRSLGVKLLVDDFGTGYSSLSQLQRLNVDVLKVDRAFTVTLDHGEEGKALFKAIVSMADALDICIVAEGVETAEQLSVLQALDCDEVQGHFVSKPVPEGEMAALMLKRFLFPPAARQPAAMPI